MSTIKNPVGPQSSAVYWRRRLVLGFGLLAVLVIIFLIVVRPGASGDESKAAKDADASKTASDTTASDTPSDASALAETDEAPVATIPEEPTEVEGAACKPANVDVEAITDLVTYQAGQLPQLSLSLTNTGKKSCVINAGTATQVFSITSGADRYWTSTDCQTDPVNAEATLEPGVPVSTATAIGWDRTRSATDTCDVEARDAAPAGGASYHLTVSVDGIESATPKQFLLY